MAFSEHLDLETRRAQEKLEQIPSLSAALAGRVGLSGYIQYLSQAYHHVKHTVPLLMAAGSRIDPKHGWLHDAIAEYIEEEKGHHEWILNDIRTCGGVPEAVRESNPGNACELFVSYLYDRIHRVNPLSVFGMVHVLEGTSVKLATQAADKIRASLGLPKEAFSYLYSHGSLDLEHYKFFQTLMDRVEDKKDQDDILHTAQMGFFLFGNILREIDWMPKEKNVA